MDEANQPVVVGTQNGQPQRPRGGSEMKFEYTVYETIAPRRRGHPVAHYDNWQDMINHWFAEFTAGTHHFFKYQVS